MRKKDYTSMSLERLLKEEKRNRINIIYAERRGDTIAIPNLWRKRQEIIDAIVMAGGDISGIPLEFRKPEEGM